MGGSVSTVTLACTCMCDLLEESKLVCKTGDILFTAVKHSHRLVGQSSLCGHVGRMQCRWSVVQQKALKLTAAMSHRGAY